MTPELIERWAAALESGEYSQAQGTLRDGDEDQKCMCCLGVLCHLIAPERWAFQRRNETWKYDGRDDLPHSMILRDAGISMETAKEFAELNDGGMRFPEIAKYVRELPSTHSSAKGGHDDSAPAIKSPAGD